MNTEQRKKMQVKRFLDEHGLEHGDRVKYIILRADSLDDLQEMVSGFMDDGYKPIGSLVASHYYIQEDKYEQWLQPVVFDKSPFEFHAVSGKGYVLAG